MSTFPFYGWNINQFWLNEQRHIYAWFIGHRNGKPAKFMTPSFSSHDDPVIALRALADTIETSEFQPKQNEHIDVPI